MDASSPKDFGSRLGRDRGRGRERCSSGCSTTKPLAGEIARPERLLAAMRHAALGGGKRLRPFLVVESAALFGVGRAGALHAGCALELMHCYSLVHDDLPAMDDDDLRRGRPTVHKAFDEATAILAGDALLTLAFDVMARAEVHPDAAVRIALVSGACARRRHRRHGRRADARSRRRRALRDEARAEQQTRSRRCRR